MRNYDVLFGDMSGYSPVKMWTRNVQVEESAIEQLKNISQLPFIYKHISVMPDVHFGNGCCIGSVIPTINAIIPNSVGCDIGCGVCAYQTTLKANNLPDNLQELRNKIEIRIPHGRTNNGGKGDRGAWHNIPDDVSRVWNKHLKEGFEKIISKYPHLTKSNSINHLSTLGTGNHFFEICLDENNDVWFMLHSGSRGIGNSIGSFFIEKAKEEMERWFIHLPDKNLAYLPEGSKYFDDYVDAVSWAQDYAMWNRKLMMEKAIQAVGEIIPINFDGKVKAVNCHHNYISKENHFGKNIWITRKGAVRARETDYGIIPGNMGGKSFIVKGKGNEESFTSCSHGAGRGMSRTEAKKRFTLEEHIEATKGVECRKDVEVIDETPMAYKDISKVMEAQKDLVEIVHTLKQVLCVKG